MYEFVHYKSTIGTSFDTSEDVQQRFCHNIVTWMNTTTTRPSRSYSNYNEADTLQRRHELQHVTTRSSRSSANYTQTHYKKQELRPETTGQQPTSSRTRFCNETGQRHMPHYYHPSTWSARIDTTTNRLCSNAEPWKLRAKGTAGLNDNDDCTHVCVKRYMCSGRGIIGPA